MPATTEAANRWLNLILNNIDYDDVGDATGIAGGTAGDLYLSLHTSSPGASGVQTTNEATYTGYARIAIDRDGSAWTVTDNAAENAAEILFAACTAGSNTITHVCIGTASSGDGHLILSGALDASLAVSAGITPRFPAGDVDVTVPTS